MNLTFGVGIDFSKGEDIGDGRKVERVFYQLVQF